jgi:hypothetical protein
VSPLPAPPRGYSTWQWFPGTHWGTGQGQYNAVDEATCMLQAQAMVEKGLVKAVCPAAHSPASTRLEALMQRRFL